MDVFKREDVKRKIRAFFSDRSVLEVQTPCLVNYGSCEPSIKNFRVKKREGRSKFLRTSPESLLKQIVCKTAKDIFELGPVFRNEENGPVHLPEFTMLEWYRVGYNYQDLMSEVSELLQYLGFTGDIFFHRYCDLFEKSYNLNPLEITTGQLSKLTLEDNYSLKTNEIEDRNLMFDLLSYRLIKRSLSCDDSIYFVYDYPKELRCYSTLSETAPSFSKRFEVFFGTLEIGNGYQEIIDAEEQRKCFAAENRIKLGRGQKPEKADVDWLRALTKSHIKELSGVAIGLERLLYKLGVIKNIRIL